MWIASAPLRVSLVGGGSDYPEHFNVNGGATFGFAISSRTYVTAIKIDPVISGHNFKISYRDIEEVAEIKAIKHEPFRIALENQGLNPGWEFSVSADLPAYTGLGSSSSFLVALIGLLGQVQNKSYTPSEIAVLAFETERVGLKQFVGMQDQIMAAYGGVCYLEFGGANNFKVTQSDKSNLGFIEKDCALVSTGTKRRAAEIVKDIAKNSKNNSGEMARLADLARATNDLYENGNLDNYALAEIVNIGWELKKKLSNLTSNSAIENQMEFLRSKGAIGMKLLGAGGGGFIFTIFPAGKKEEICRELPGMNIKNVLISESGLQILNSEESRV